MHRISQLFNDGSTVPTAFVTVGRQRVKQYGNNNLIYLKNNSTFEIELFNPCTNKVLAKIELNGISIGSGIVLRPGERVFLERYLDDAKKFLFETYEVDGNNPSVQKAIIENGKVSIKFYSEYINYGITVTNNGYSWGTFNPTWQTSYTSCLNNYSTPTFDCSDNFASDIKMSSISTPGQSIETGRIEKGSNSNQVFTYDSTIFNTWWSWSSEWKILPLSQKQIVREDLKLYCSSCGRRQRKSEFFCPSCGKKF